MVENAKPALSQAPGFTLAQLIANELADGTIAVGDRLLVPIATPTGARSLDIDVASHIVYVFTSDDAAAAVAQRRDEDAVLDGTEVSVSAAAIRRTVGAQSCRYEWESATFVATCDRWRLLWGREAGRIGEHLIVALAVDERDRVDPDRDLLAPDDFRSLGQQAARAAMRALAVRICERCEAPLYGPEDRQSGYCAPCRGDRAALVQIAAGGGQ